MITGHGWIITDAGRSCRAQVCLPLVAKRSTGALRVDGAWAVPSSR